MKKTFWILLTLCMLPLAAHTEDGLPDFSDFASIMPGADENNSTDAQMSSDRNYGKENIIPFIKSSISETAAQIISNPEQTFCYEVTKRTANDKRYTLDGFALSGFCGELDKGATSTAYSALFTQSPNILTQTAQCRIEPKLMIRFVRGVDYADVLLSSPCPSFTIFYAGKYKSFNIKQGVIDDIITQLSKKIETFHSPALLKKTVANAEANSAEESEALEMKRREHASQTIEQEEDKTTPATQQKSGWGNINLNFKK